MRFTSGGDPATIELAVPWLSSLLHGRFGMGIGLEPPVLWAFFDFLCLSAGRSQDAHRDWSESELESELDESSGAPGAADELDRLRPPDLLASDCEWDGADRPDGGEPASKSASMAQPSSSVMAGVPFESHDATIMTWPAATAAGARPVPTKRG